MKFRKKPVVIEAVQITAATFNAPHPNPEYVPGVRYDPIHMCAYIDTDEGVMRGNLGDWIITGIKGEHYPCKPDIFEATYESLEAAESAGPAKLTYRGCEHCAHMSESIDSPDCNGCFGTSYHPHFQPR